MADMGGSDGTTVTNVSGPPDWLAPYVEQLIGVGFGAAGQVDRNPYGYDRIAGPSPFQEEALGGGMDIVRGLGARLPEGFSFTDNAVATARGDYLSPESNPYLSASMDASTEPLRAQLQNEILPGLSANAVTSGAYGGSGQALAEGTAIGDYGEAAARIRAQMLDANYQRERQNQLNAPAMYGAGVDADMLPMAIMSGLGAQDQALQQTVLDNIFALYGMDQQSPFNGLNQLAGLMGLGGTQNNTTTPPNPAAPVQGALGGASSGYLLGSQIGSGFGPWGALIGAGLGYATS